MVEIIGCFLQKVFWNNGTRGATIFILVFIWFYTFFCDGRLAFLDLCTKQGHQKIPYLVTHYFRALQLKICSVRPFSNLLMIFLLWTTVSNLPFFFEKLRCLILIQGKYERRASWYQKFIVRTAQRHLKIYF